MYSVTLFITGIIYIALELVSNIIYKRDFPELGYMIVAVVLCSINIYIALTRILTNK
jgi:hypothetical protein